MEITEVRVFLAEEDDERLKAYATVTFDNCFVVRDLKVIDGNTGLFLAMPSKKRKDGTYKDVAHPINKDFREMVEQQVFDKYREETQGVASGMSPRRRDDDNYDSPNVSGGYDSTEAPANFSATNKS